MGFSSCKPTVPSGGVRFHFYFGEYMAKVETWMPWYPGDYLRDTITLNLEEDCVYRRAIDHLWQNPQGIPIETDRLILALRITEPQLFKTRWVLDKYLKVGNGVYYSDRVNMERDKALKKLEVKRKNGSLGGRPLGSGNKPIGYDSHNLQKTPSPSPSLSASSEADKEKEKMVRNSGNSESGSVTGGLETVPLTLKFEENRGEGGVVEAESIGRMEADMQAGGRVGDQQTVNQPTEKKAPLAKKQFPHDSYEYQVANVFYDQFVRLWAPSAKPPTEAILQGWARELDLMIRVDERDPDDLDFLLNWIHRQKPDSRSGFAWKKNILSMGSLREHWNKGHFEECFQVKRKAAYG